MMRFTLTIPGPRARRRPTATASTAPDTLKAVENPTEVTIVTGGSQSLSLTVRRRQLATDFLAETLPRTNR